MAGRCELLLAVLVACSTLVASARILAEPAFIGNLASEPVGTENDRPLIGILSQPGSPAPKGGSYIAASYIKFVESAGGRAVPLESDLTREEMAEKVSKINGVLLPGGGAALEPGHPFFDAVAHLVNLTKEANDAGEYFPLHGTCLGFEALAIVVSGERRSPLTHFNSEDNPSALILTEDAQGSRFFGGMPAIVTASLQALPLAMENHQAGLSVDTLNENSRLRDFFKVTALSTDRDGLEYIANMEARDYPITATQWHPEKNAFEFADFLHIPHSPAAVEVTHAVAMFVVGEARKNSRRPSSRQEEADLLIFNNALKYTGKSPEEDFEQVYVFHGRKHREGVTST